MLFQMGHELGSLEPSLLLGLCHPPAVSQLGVWTARQSIREKLANDGSQTVHHFRPCVGCPVACSQKPPVTTLSKSKNIKENESSPLCSSHPASLL